MASRRPVFLAVGAVICLAVTHSAVAQNSPSASAAQPLRLAVASEFGKACGGAFAPSATRQQIENRLRSAGLTVSNVHTELLSIDVDCVALGSGARTGSTAVHECLEFSELVSTASHTRGAALASTWRKCQSFVCSRGNCDPPLRAGVNGLLNEFLGTINRRIRAVPASPVAAPVPVPVQVRAPVPTVAYAMAQVTVVSSRGLLLFYSVYILACMSVLLYWHFRGSATNMLRTSAPSIAEQQRYVLRQVHLPVRPAMPAVRGIENVLHLLLREHV